MSTPEIRFFVLLGVAALAFAFYLAFFLLFARSCSAQDVHDHPKRYGLDLLYGRIQEEDGEA